MIEVGDYVCIRESVIDQKVAQLLLDNKNKQAIRWDSYRNFAFKVIAVEGGLYTLHDAQNHVLQLSKKALEKAEIQPE